MYVYFFRKTEFSVSKLKQMIDRFDNFFLQLFIYQKTEANTQDQDNSNIKTVFIKYSSIPNKTNLINMFRAIRKSLN